MTISSKFFGAVFILVVGILAFAHFKAGIDDANAHKKAKMAEQVEQAKQTALSQLPSAEKLTKAQAAYKSGLLKTAAKLAALITESDLEWKEAQELQLKIKEKLKLAAAQEKAEEKKKSLLMEKERKAKEIAEKREKKRQGVSIGMTKQDVYDSSWGRPQSVNKTTTAYGTHEQWVYSGGYLYFENGFLTTIQH